MQQHWHEPLPLGDAQRAGMMQVSRQPAPAVDPRREAAIRQQIARQHAAMRAPSLFHSVTNFLTGGAGGILLGAIGGVALGYWFGSARERSVLTKRLGEKALVAGNPGDDEDEDEEFEDPRHECSVCGEMWDWAQSAEDCCQDEKIAMLEGWDRPGEDEDEDD